MDVADEVEFSNDLASTLVLAGYVALSPVGFALPHYGLRRVANQWYVATCTPAGDPKGRVTGFWPADLSEVTALSHQQIRDVSIGDQWLDVFLWDGKVYVGTRAELWIALAAVQDDIAVRAPLSGVDLALGGDDADLRKMIQAGKAFISETYGSSHVRDWQRQTARTRLLSRLQGVGVTPRISLEIVGAGAGTALKIDTSEWGILAEGEWQRIFDAASSTARELDLELTVRRAMSPPEVLPPHVSRSVLELLPNLEEEPSSDLFGGEHMASAPHSILVLTVGPRAVRIGGAAKPLDWAPEWSEAASRSRAPIVRGKIRSWLQPSWIEVRTPDEQPIARSYGVVVVVLDDKFATDTVLRENALDLGRSFAGSDGVILLAPALPEDRPARALRPQHFGLGTQADLILDTSLARSPLWGTPERHSLERRIADLILTSAQACLPGSVIRRKLIALRKNPRAPTFASLGLWNQDHQNDASPGELALVSEANAPRGGRPWLDEYVPLRGGGGGRPIPLARLRVGEQQFSFLAYTDAVLQHYVRRGLISENDIRGGDEKSPDAILRELRNPDSIASIELHGRNALLIAETPSIRALTAARRSGRLVVRLTDDSGLRRTLDSTTGRSAIPTEVSLPTLKRFALNRRLAIRGVDTRDIVRVPALSHLQPDIFAHRTLGLEARMYLSPSSDEAVGDVVAIPIAPLEAIVDRDGLAEQLLSQYRPRVRTAKRLGDLAVLWNHPSFRRYILEDGQLPPRLIEIDGAAIVPAQTYFAIDGDESIPCLFGSNLFAVWARLTRSRGKGWAQRFATSRTFETFPIVGPFRPATSPSGGRALLFDGNSRLKQISGRLSVPSVRLALKAESDSVQTEDVRQEVDQELLKHYGLAPHASELEIAEMLLELNARMGELPLGRADDEED